MNCSVILQHVIAFVNIIKIIRLFLYVCIIMFNNNVFKINYIVQSHSFLLAMFSREIIVEILLIIIEQIIDIIIVYEHCLLTGIICKH